MWIPAPQSSHKSLSSPDQDLQLSRCPTRKQLDAGWSNFRFTSPKILPPSLVSSISLASDQNKTFEQGKLVDLAGLCSPVCGPPQSRFLFNSINRLHYRLHQFHHRCHQYRQQHCHHHHLKVSIEVTPATPAPDPELDYLPDNHPLRKLRLSSSSSFPAGQPYNLNEHWTQLTDAWINMLCAGQKQFHPPPHHRLLLSYLVSPLTLVGSPRPSCSSTTSSTMSSSLPVGKVLPSSPTSSTPSQKTLFILSGISGAPAPRGELVSVSGSF